MSYYVLTQRIGGGKIGSVLASSVVRPARHHMVSTGVGRFVATCCGHTKSPEQIKRNRDRINQVPQRMRRCSIAAGGVAEEGEYARW
jgi:hypothetical protein